MLSFYLRTHSILKNLVWGTIFLPSNAWYLCVQKQVVCSICSLRKSYNSLINCKHFPHHSFSVYILVLEDCIGSIVMVQFTIHSSANSLFDFSTYVWLLITWPYIVLSQVNADICKIRFRKWTIRWVKEKTLRGDTKSKSC